MATKMVLAVCSARTFVKKLRRKGDAVLVNVGLRTDIVACYTEWLLRRFEEGYAYARNPLFPKRVSKYLLDSSHVDAILFCSKNYAPLLPHIKEILSKHRTYFFYTVTAYGEDLEPNVPSIEESVETLKELSTIVGKKRVSWRYDPVLLTPSYSVEKHIQTFGRLARELSPYVNGCVFSFVEMFPRLSTRISELIPLKAEDKLILAENFGRIASSHSLPLRFCGNNDFSRFGITNQGCVTLTDIGTANDCEFKAYAHRGNKRGCRCITSRDLGWYNTCPLRCKYCNANRDFSELAKNLTRHDPTSPLLIGTLEEDDSLTVNREESFLKNDGRQISLFDF